MIMFWIYINRRRPTSTIRLRFCLLFIYFYYLMKIDDFTLNINKERMIAMQKYKSMLKRITCCMVLCFISLVFFPVDTHASGSKLDILLGYIERDGLDQGVSRRLCRRELIKQISGRYPTRRSFGRRCLDKYSVYFPARKVKTIFGNTRTYVPKRTTHSVPHKESSPIVHKESSLITYEELRDDILYVRIYGFDRKTGGDFKEIVSIFLKKSDATMMILDLRDNNGGVVASGSEVLLEFNKNPDDIMYTERLHSRKIVHTFGGEFEKLSPIQSIIEGLGRLAHHRVVILINKKTASVAEMVAKTLQELSYRGAKFTVVGEKSYGKGFAQSNYQFKDGSRFILTTREILSGEGQLKIEGVGVTPDHRVKGKDKQLTFAIDLLNKSRENRSHRGEYHLDKGGTYKTLFT